jgi:hypothetical protein
MPNPRGQPAINSRLGDVRYARLFFMLGVSSLGNRPFKDAQPAWAAFWLLFLGYLI